MNMKYLNGISAFLMFLVVSMPFCLAQEMSLIYDANGNLVTGDGFYRTYNSLNQLWKVYNGTNSSGILLEEYTYHPVEERVAIKKVYNSTGAVIETTYYFSKEFVRVINTTGVYNYTYVYQDGALVAQDVNGVKTFFVNDAKGNIVATMNSTGAVIETDFYSPTGEVLVGGNKSRYQYEGKELDKTTGITNYNARMYSSSTDQFSQANQNIQNVFNAQDLNHYAFERNNPYKYIDPDGKDAWLIVDPKGAGIGFKDNQIISFGHVALIVGNDGKYEVYSQGAADTGGLAVKLSSNVEGGVYISEVYSTKEEAMSSLGGSYTEAAHFVTDSTKDKAMHDAAVVQQAAYEKGDKKYNLISSNCADFTTDILKSGGVSTKSTGLNNIPIIYAKTIAASQAKKPSLISKIVTSITNLFSSKNKKVY